MAKKKHSGFFEIKGSQKTLYPGNAKKIVMFEKNGEIGMKDGVVWCGPISKNSKKFYDEHGIFYVENVSIDDVMAYDILQEYNQLSNNKEKK